MRKQNSPLNSLSSQTRYLRFKLTDMISQHGINLSLCCEDPENVFWYGHLHRSYPDLSQESNRRSFAIPALNAKKLNAKNVHRATTSTGVTSVTLSDCMCMTCLEKYELTSDTYITPVSLLRKYVGIYIFSSKSLEKILSVFTFTQSDALGK